MQTQFGTTPFGGRPMSLALLAAQKAAQEAVAEGRAVDKWAVYRDLCEAKSVIGIGDRSLAVLAALLSFHPENELSEETGLIVFPSNHQLSLRAHGMAGPTLRRHLAALVEAGLIIRRDSPNGKRYARKSRGGEIEEAFGFSLAPLVARAAEIATAAEQIRAEAAEFRLMRERVTLLRRDIAKLIDVALEEKMEGDWHSLWQDFRRIVEAIPRRATLRDVRAAFDELLELRCRVDKALEIKNDSDYLSGKDAQSERQYTESNTDSYFELELAQERAQVTPVQPTGTAKPPATYPLGFVLKACPDIAEYALNGIENWRDFKDTAAQVRGYLGISPSAYEDALAVMGPENTAIVIACILQRASQIQSAGGYLRALTEKARVGEFSVGPMLMAGLKAHGGGSPGRMAG